MKLGIIVQCRFNSSRFKGKILKKIQNKTILEILIERLNSGADLIQIYTGFIYRGPSLIKEINKAIINQSN